jgi:hypothetical protein
MTAIKIYRQEGISNLFAEMQILDAHQEEKKTYIKYFLKSRLLKNHI